MGRKKYSVRGFLKREIIALYITYLYFIYSLDVSSLTHEKPTIQRFEQIRTLQGRRHNPSKYIHCTGLPLIQTGLLPLPHDIRILELGTLETLRGQDKVNLEQWVRKHYSDPRSKNKV
jgi:hypothetical protein